MKTETDEAPEATMELGTNAGVSILDLFLRGIAIIGTLGSTVAMGTTSESTLFSQFVIRTKYTDLPTFKFFVIANSIACGYLFLSLPVSVFHLIRRRARITRIILVALDTVMLALITSGASAATAIVYLAHKGNNSTNWVSICQQLDSFCERISGSLIGSFAAIVLLILMIIAAAVSLSR